MNVLFFKDEISLWKGLSDQQTSPGKFKRLMAQI